jgi:hypothetical protein
MKLTCNSPAFILLSAGLLLAGCSNKQQHLFSSLKDADAAKQLKQFVTDKVAQANASTNEPAPAFAPFFAAAQRGDWLAVSNSFKNLSRQAPQYQHSGPDDDRLRGPRWAAAMEIWGAYYAFEVGDEKYSAAYGRDIIASIPPGSIYFGGTDPGRFVVTAMCRSQVNGDPFFVLTQNALADGSYLDYLRQIYGEKIRIPDPGDSQHCFEEYARDLKERSDNHQLKPGEKYSLDSHGNVIFGGLTAVMEINGLLVKDILDKNPGQDVYLEQSFPVDWMYPQLEPHGLIFKLNRQPVTTLPDDVVQQDHEYWAKYVQPMIGDWLKDDTSIADIATFAGKTFGQHDFSGFKGDRHFIQNKDAQREFSKLRASIAEVYAWRASHAADSADGERMAHEADFAFRQAWALCPDLPEAVNGYTKFLEQQKRGADALIVAKTATKMPGQGGNQFRTLVRKLEKTQTP